MHSIALEFETEQEMKKVAEQLWQKHDVSGEMEMYPTASGHYRLHIYAEKPIKDSVLDKLPGKRVSSKSSYETASTKEVANED